VGAWFVSSPAWQVVAMGIAWFALLYFSVALGGTLLVRAMAGAGFGRVIDPRPLPAGQVARETAQACGSIAVFGIGLLLPWGLLRAGWAQLAQDPSTLRIAAELAVLFVWNELHFYATHRLLHTPWLRRFHAGHHRSHTPTPFSTYAFHPVEAALLGSVPLLPMLVHDFSFAALVGLTVLSIVLNGLGHANYEFSRRAPARGPLGASRRHHLHHACYGGNYGFLLTAFDRALGTALPLDAAEERLAKRATLP
jgi:lathosterol oxidase